MPNPIAHPAAAIPFTKLKLVFSALLIGSIAPDLGYLVYGGESHYMYTLRGLFLFDLPAGFISLWLFDVLAKWPLLSLLPIGLQRRLYDPARRFSFGPLKHFGVILLSLLVGSITHIAWDSFTHDNGWTVEHFSFFRTPIRGIPLYSILQNLSTFAGLALLIYWFGRWVPRASRSLQVPAHFSSRVQGFCIILIGLSLLLAVGLSIYERLFLGWYNRIVALTFLMTFLFISTYCLAWMIAFHKTIEKAASAAETE